MTTIYLVSRKDSIQVFGMTVDVKGDEGSHVLAVKTFPVSESARAEAFAKRLMELHNADHFSRS